MNGEVLSKSYPPPPLCRRDMLRYAGCRGEADGETAALLEDCLREAEGKLAYRVCYRELAVTICGDICDFGLFRVESRSLAGNLKGCDTVLLFAATVGVELDRLIARYGRLSPAKALLLQAIGAERIEALCDVFCREMAQERGMALRPRFSPGYGDVPLTAQRQIFAVLDCPGRIGLTLNDSLLMSPSKSVTAFVGLTAGGPTVGGCTCATCEKTDCLYRGAL